MRLASPNATPDTKDAAAAVLQWALDSIVYEKADKDRSKRRSPLMGPNRLTVYGPPVGGQDCLMHCP
jgi:hypothetical protein